jgi:hypothetical protein
MNSSSAPNDVAVLRAYAARIARLVLPDAGGLDRIDALAWVDAGILRDSLIEGAIGEVESVVAAAKANKYRGRLGPMLFYSRADKSLSAVRISDLVLDSRPAVREAGVACLDRLFTRTECFAPKTVESLTSHRKAVVGTNRQWRQAAIAIAEALESDWLLNVAGVKQCESPSMGAAWNRYLSAVLKPTVADLQHCVPQTLSATIHGEAIDRKLAQLCAERLELPELLRKYCNAIGHLCLGGPRAFSTILGSARPNGLKTKDVASLFKTAEVASNEFFQYHLSEALIGRWEILTSHQRTTLSKWTCDIVFTPLADAQRKIPSAACLSNDLARYFIEYLELRVPATHGEPIAAMAWWMSKQLSDALSAMPQEWSSFCEQLETLFTAPVRTAWDLVGPALTPSSVRLLTLREHPSPWALSLLSSIRSREVLQMLLIPEDNAAKAERQHELISYSVQVANLFLEGDARLFRFAAGIDHLLRYLVTKDADGSGRQVVSDWPESIDWNLPGAMTKLLNDLPKQSAPLQQWRCHALYQRIVSGGVEATTLWEVVSSDKWRSSTWHELDPKATEMLAKCLIEDATLRRPEWWPHLPHMLALMTEAHSSDEIRRFHYFELVLRACLKLSAGSALHRLLASPAGHRFRPMARAVRENMEQHVPHVDAWAAGRLRGAIVDLSR